MVGNSPSNININKEGNIILVFLNDLGSNLLSVC